MAEFKPNYGNSASQNTLSSNDADDTVRTPQVINVPHQHKNQGIDNKIPGICVEDTTQGPHKTPSTLCVCLSVCGVTLI